MFDYEYDEAELLAALQLSDASEEIKATTVEQVNDLLQDRVGIRVEMLMTDEQLAAFNKLDNVDAARQFVLDLVPSLNDIYDEEFAGIIAQYQIGLDDDEDDEDEI